MKPKTPGQLWREQHPESKNECIGTDGCSFAARTLDGHNCHSIFKEGCKWYCGEPKEKNETA